MKIIFKKNEIINTANKINKIASLYRTNELYANLKIIAKDNILFKINNDIAFMSIACEGNILEEGEICFNANSFANIVNNINSEEITVECNSSTVSVKGTNSNVAIAATSIENFVKEPDLKTFEKEQSFSLSNKVLYNGFLDCFPFEDSKSIISGLNFDIKDNKIRLCCCSEAGGSLHYITDIKFKKEKNINFTIDTRFLREFKDIFANEEIVLDVYGRFICIHTDKINLILKFLNKSFPLIEKVIPSSFKSELPLIKSEFEQAFNLIDVVTSEKDAYIKYKKNKCSIEHPKGVNLTVDIDRELDEEFRVNRDLLRKALKLIDKEEIVLLFNDLPKPIVIKDENLILLISVLVK